MRYELKEDLGYHTFVLPLGFQYKVLFVPDIHMRDREFKNTINYVAEQERILNRILDGVKRGLYNTIVFLGDVFDCPYKDVSKALYHISILENIYMATEGRVFEVLSNHPINNKKNSVLTFFLVGQIKAKRFDQGQTLVQTTTNGFVSNYGLSSPIINCPDRIWINGNLISLFHYSRFNKNYHDPLTDLNIEPFNHIGAYHDAVMNSQARAYVQDLSVGDSFQIPFLESVESTKIFSNVDYAFIGDIHTKVGEFSVHNYDTGKTTLADLPGTLGRTANHKSQHHNDVMLPLLTIEPDGRISKEHIHMELRDWKEIFKTEVQEEEKEQRQRMTDFRGTIESLGRNESFEQKIAEADIESRTKDILIELYNNSSYVIPYKDRLRELYDS